MTGGPLHLGDIEDLGNDDDDCHITCPWHAFRYSLVDGSSPEDEDHDATVFETRLCDGSVELHLDGQRVVEQIEWIPEPGFKVSEESEEIKEAQDALANISITSKDIASESISKESSHQPETLAEWASLVLRTPDAQEKVALTHKVASMWNDGEIKEVCVA
jgi:hypothetical protein